MSNRIKGKKTREFDQLVYSLSYIHVFAFTTLITPTVDKILCFTLIHSIIKVLLVT